MKVAIVIPFYNEELSIIKTLSSFKMLVRVFSSSLFVLVNNNSTDGSILLIQKFQKENPLVTVCVVNEKRQGVEYARKTGLDFALTHNPDVILSTDADTVLDPRHNKRTIKDIAEFNKGRFDIFIGEGTIPIKMYVLRMIYFKDFVEIKRKIWNLYYKLFGPYFFGSFFCIKGAFYKKIGGYFIPGTSPIKEEDLLLSRRCYYMNGKILISKVPYVKTSPRRFLHDPYQWITGKRVGNFRGSSIPCVSNSLNKVRQNVDLNFQVISDTIIRLTSKRLWIFFEDAYIFNKKTRLSYKRVGRSIQAFCSFFSLGGIDENSDLKKLRIEYEKISGLKLHQYLFNQ